MSEITRNDNPKKALMIKALEKSLGNVSSACNSVNMSRETHYRWLSEDEDYKNNVESVNDYAIDFVESKLMANINNNDNTAILFYLKCKGKKRGWIEKSEILNTNINYNKEVTDEEMNELLDKMKRMTE